MRSILTIFCLLFAATVADASAFRCGDRLVDSGDRDIQVRGKCGEPFWIDRYSAVDVLNAGGVIEQQREINKEVWYYNFGRNVFMQRLVFKNGVLRSIESLGYGRDDIGSDCSLTTNYRGLYSGELAARCGQPSVNREYHGTIVARPAPGLARYNEDRREEWIYDFGGQYLSQYLLLNGRVTGMQQLSK